MGIGRGRNTLVALLLLLLSGDVAAFLVDVRAFIVGAEELDRIMRD